MVTIYGLSINHVDELAEVGFIDEVHINEGGQYDVDLSEEIKVSYHFGTLKLSDIKNFIELDQLDFVKIVIE